MSLFYGGVTKGDLCASFIQKIMQLMNERDVLGVVSQNNWMYLSSFKNFREILLSTKTLLECIDLGSNSFEDINGEKTNIALCIIVAADKKPSHFFNLKYTSYTEKRSFLLKNIIPDEFHYELDQNKFLQNNNLEFNYQLKHGFKNLHKLKPYLEFAKPMQGTSTGNNSKFVKYAWEVNGNPNWKLVRKGGGFSKWAGLNYYKVHWGHNAEIIKANKGSALRNIDKIPYTQLVYSDTGTLGLNVRTLSEKQVFIASDPGIRVLKGDKYARLAFLNSRIATFLIKLINPKFTISAGYISKIPVAENILDSKYIAMKSKKCLGLKEKYLQKKLPNPEFQHYDYKNIENIDAYLESSIVEDIENDYQRLLLEYEIEVEIKKQFNLSKNELHEMKKIVDESPFMNKNKILTTHLNNLDLLLHGNIDLNYLSTSRAINGYSIGSESILENLSCKLDTNPKEIFNLIKNNILILKKTKKKYFNNLLHKIILRELGTRKISVYKTRVFNIKNISRKIKSNYAFLDDQPALTRSIISILSNHHKKSFFNTPLISISDNSIIVGEAQ